MYHIKARVTQLIKPVMLVTQVQAPSATRDISPRDISPIWSLYICAPAYISICAHQKSQTLAAMPLLDTKILHTLVGMGSAALSAAVL